MSRRESAPGIHLPQAQYCQLIPASPPAAGTNTDSARESYIEAQQDLARKHQALIAEKMNNIRNAIEEGINKGQDVAPLEEVFDRLEREFWDQYLDPVEGVDVKKEEQ